MKRFLTFLESKQLDDPSRMDNMEYSRNVKRIQSHGWNVSAIPKPHLFNGEHEKFEITHHGDIVAEVDSDFDGWWHLMEIVLKMKFKHHPDVQKPRHRG